MSTKDVIIHLKLPRSPRRRWAVGIIAALLAAGAAGWAAAPEAFIAGEPLSAAKLNANFAGLSGRLDLLEATYCGKAAITSGKLDNSNGYAAAASLCRTVPGCGAAAHMCTTAEMVRYATSGQTTPEQGWIASGVTTYDSSQSSSAWHNDCGGYVSDTAHEKGATWSGARASFSGCESKLPIHCCD
jgi:hypothetical protein